MGKNLWYQLQTTYSTTYADKKLNDKKFAGGGGEGIRKEDAPQVGRSISSTEINNNYWELQ